MKAFFNEFKQFIQRGNVIDMAVGVIIGAAFKAIVDALVSNILSPLLGLLVRVDFTELMVEINGVPLQYGAFIMAVINFFIMAFALFVIVKVINSLKRKPKEAPPVPVTTKVCPYCCSEIPLAAVRCSHCTSVLEEEK